MNRRSLLRASAVLLALTVFHTWPHAVRLGAAFVDHHDPYFSVWRLSWIAHALVTQPSHLFDANIYYPELRTLAYSDATLLEGLLGAPFIWMGVTSVAVYNGLLLMGFAGSALAMYVLAYELTRDDDASLVAAAVFLLVPYRIEHLMRLELQWAMWIPLTLWAVHRTIDTPSWKWGLLSGLFLWLQFLSCVYYGVFLTALAPILGLMLMATRPDRARCAIPALLAGALVAALLTAVYAWPYLKNADTLGPRSLDEIALYSARPVHYLTSPGASWLWGWTADLFGSQELRLYPGVVAMALALVGILSQSRANGVDLRRARRADDRAVVRDQRPPLSLARGPRAVTAGPARHRADLDRGLLRIGCPRRARLQPTANPSPAFPPGLSRRDTRGVARRFRRERSTDGLDPQRAPRRVPVRT